MENGLQHFYIITRHTCFTVNAESAEGACEAFLMGIRLRRCLLAEPAGPARQAIAQSLQAVFFSPNGRDSMPAELLEEDLRNQLLFTVMDEKRKRAICTFSSGKLTPFISREAFAALGHRLPGQGFGGVYDYVKAQLDERDRLLGSLDGLIGHA